MFWDMVAPIYNFYENIYNGKVNRQLQQEVAALIHPSDRVLECACGAGMLSVPIAELLRVCKPGGKLIIPTYINIERDGNPDAEYVLVDGKMPCAIAIITKEENVENE